MENNVEADRVSACGDAKLPWGVYVPPPLPPVLGVSKAKGKGEASSAEVILLPEESAQLNEHHGGYVRIVDLKGKSFPCGFTRSIGFVIDTVISRKRSRSMMTADSKCSEYQENDNSGDELGDEHVNTNSGTEVRQQKKTITETRLHPEEALFEATSPWIYC